MELLNLPSSKGANVWRSYSASSGTKKAGRPREIGDLVHWHFVCVKRYQKSGQCAVAGVACSCSMWVKRRGPVQLQTVQTMTSENQLAGRLATFRFGL